MIPQPTPCIKRKLCSRALICPRTAPKKAEFTLSSHYFFAFDFSAFLPSITTTSIG